MKKFNFNMDTLLRIRKQKESAAQIEVKKAQETLDKIIHLIKRLKEETALLNEELIKKQKQKLSIDEFQSHLLYLHALKEKIALQEDEAFKAQNILAKKQELVKKAMQNKKIIENLKDKQFSLWEKRIAQLEGKVLDELATIRHIRDKKG